MENDKTKIDKEVQEIIHGINLQPINKVNTWDTKRVIAYKNRIQKHISYINSHARHRYNLAGYPDLKEQLDVAYEKFKNYKEELKKILERRENVESKTKK